MSEPKWEEVKGGELLKWDKPKSLEGVLVRREEKPDTGKGPGHLYEVKTKEGTIPFFAPTLLHKKLRDVSDGKLIRVKFTGVSKTKAGNDVKEFEVAHTDPTEDNLKALGIEVFSTNEDDGFGGM